MENKYGEPEHIEVRGAKVHNLKTWTLMFNCTGL